MAGVLNRLSAANNGPKGRIVEDAKPIPFRSYQTRCGPKRGCDVRTKFPIYEWLIRIDKGRRDRNWCPAYTAQDKQAGQGAE